MAHWVTTDLHGEYELWQQIKNNLKEEDILIYLGDAIDRGGRGFEIFKEMIEHPQVIYLLGNHELMMYDAFFSEGKARTNNLTLWLGNDGGQTLNNIKALGLSAKEYLPLIEKIDDMSHYAEYTNKMGVKFFLCHAGTTLGHYYQNTADKAYQLLWDRDHFYTPWPQDKELDLTIVVHGHTPIVLMKKLYGFQGATGAEPFFYDGCHKLNLDAATPYTKMAFLYNLDTLQTKKLFIK